MPLLREIESTCEDSEKYDFYYEKCAPIFDFRKIHEPDKNFRLVLYGFTDNVISFLFEMARYYDKRNYDENTKIITAEKELLEFLSKNRKYIPESQIVGLDYRKDSCL